ncbi:hypothetical protein B0T21DRAFT_414023 [Apiosordaria backusii]|uniref:Uncharacterized protein n=1 Tax=Apiosordaria backusii TaxID=314023 RepID=A0AA40AX54_9PEZI|nr:hypothetical protein B0T21DRAFT_414023 [Apiosordaria backusii]
MALYLHESRRRTGSSPNSSESTLEIDIRLPPQDHNYSSANRRQYAPASSARSFFPEPDLPLAEGYSASCHRRSRTPDPRHRRTRSQVRFRAEHLREEYLDHNENITDAIDTYITTPRSSRHRRRGRSMPDSNSRVRETETIMEHTRQLFTDIRGNPAFTVDTTVLSGGDTSEQRARVRRRAEREARREREREGAFGPMPPGTEAYSFDGSEFLDRHTLRRMRGLMSFGPWRTMGESRGRR